jgi:hypothetical protein
VAAAGADLGEVNGGRTVVLNLDIWDRWTGMRVYQQVTDARDTDRTVWLWEAEDDRGSRYLGFSTGGSGSNRWWQGYVDLFPSMDPAASSVTVRLSGGDAHAEATIDLTRDCLGMCRV